MATDLNLDPTLWAQRELIAGIGIVTPQRKYPKRRPDTRVVGTACYTDHEGRFIPILMADDGTLTSDPTEGRPTVRVIRDGISTIVPAASFRRKRERSYHRPTVGTNPSLPESARLRPVQDYSQDS